MHSPFNCERLRTLRALTCCAVLTLTLIARAESTPQNAEAAPPATERSSDPAIEASEQTVEVRALESDESIEARLRSIIGASRQFDELDVEVTEGIVFLKGRAPDVERRDWASSVARRTKGAVAVVNDMSLEEAPLWSLAPAHNALVELWRATLRAVPLVLIGLVLLAFMLRIAGAAARAVGRSAERRLDSPIIAAFLRRATLVAGALLGAYLALQVSGLTRLAATVLGGTSLIGLAFGFAFRDIAENFLSGVLLSMQRPFRLGDTIEASGHTGVVRAVTSHGTQLIDFDGNVVRLSNTSLYKGVIRNMTANPKSRDSFVVGIGYDSSIERAQEELLTVMRAQEAVLGDPEPIVVVKELGSSTVQLEAYFWVDATRYSRVRVRSTIMRLALAALDDAGISMPDDAREVLFPEPLAMRVLRSGDAAPEARTSHAARKARSAARMRARPQVEAAAGEGSLTSEVATLQQQADASGATDAGGLLERGAPKDDSKALSNATATEDGQ
ncbi:MAG: mechanosensitive ion channel family protein [Planctomycetota bacterium]